MTLQAEAWVLNFFGAGDTLWRYSTNHLFSQDHSDRPNFHHLSLFLVEIPHLPPFKLLTLSAFTSSRNFHVTHLAQTYQKPTRLILSVTAMSCYMIQ